MFLRVRVRLGALGYFCMFLYLVAILRTYELMGQLRVECPRLLVGLGLGCDGAFGRCNVDERQAVGSRDYGSVIQ